MARLAKLEVFMNTKKYLIPLMASLALGLSACGGESDSAAAPVDPFNSTPMSQAGPVPASSTGTTPSTPAGTVAALASVANPNVPIGLYPSWLGFHYVTLEAESQYYVDFASGFSYVFNGPYAAAGRVIWSTQASNNQCKTEISGAMKSRACTVSEGIGYGMLIAAFQNDAETFNRLWNYSRGYRAYNNQNLTPWITRSFTFDLVDNSSATDADLDIATSLILMYQKTQNQEYLNDALVIAKAIWDEEIEPGTYMIMSGNTSMWNGKNGKPITYNLSYFSPVALRLFAMYDGTHQWEAVLNAMYDYMQKMQAAGTGVFPDWSLIGLTSVNPPNGAAGNEKTGFTYHSFNKESVRIPWRIAWDYYWFQDPRALSVLTVLNNFIVAKSNGDPGSAALAINYSWNLAEGADVAKNTSVPTQWLAAWCATGIGTNSKWLEDCTKLVNASPLTNNANSYFTDILLMLYSELLNGMFTKTF